MVVESWESVQVNLNVPRLAQGTSCEHLQIACTKPFTAELMNISRLWDLSEKIEELFYLLIFLEVKDDLDRTGMEK